MKFSRFTTLFIFFSLTFFVQGYAQTGHVRGFIYDKEDGEAVIFTNVYLKGTSYGVATDVNGFFSIANVPVGKYTLMVSSIDYDSLSVEIEIKKNKDIVDKKLFLNKRNIRLKQLTISGRRMEKMTNPEPGKIVITPEQINKLPSVGGEPDLAQYLQVLPGVIFTGDQGGQLYIRGGAPIHNKVLLDGMVIYNPFHSIGFFSVFETDFIKNVDVHTGGFGAEFGGRISAVVDIKTRDGNKTRFAGKISGSPFMGKILLEGPISKLKDDKGTSSFMLAAKHSYLDKTSRSIYSYVNNGETLNSASTKGIPYSFTDVYGKLALSTKQGNKVNIFGFNYKDSVNFTDVTSFNWKSLGFGSNFVVVPGGTNVLINGTFAYSNYRMRFNEADEDPRTSFVGGFNLGVDLTYFIPAGEIQYGFEVNGFKTDFNFFNQLGLKVEQTQFTSELGAFVKYRKVIGPEKFVIEPSFRVQFYSSLSTISPEPRLGIKYNFSEKVRFKAGTGFYSQNLISTKSDQDVVNLFTGFLSGPDETITRPNGEDAKHKLQKSFHVVGGIEYDPIDKLELTVEPYLKQFTQLIQINRNKLFPTDPDFTAETGKAYGIDFLAKYQDKRLFLWLAYSLGWVTRTDSDQTYNPHYDRRHNANVVASYTLGDKMDWEISARWNMGSGFPFTKTQGFYESINFLDGVSTDYTTVNGDLGIIYEDELNQGRLPYYHRLDLSGKKKFNFTERVKMEVVVSVTNVYDRENVFFFDRVRYERVNQLPILPSLALNLSF